MKNQIDAAGQPVGGDRNQWTEMWERLMQQEDELPRGEESDEVFDISGDVFEAIDFLRDYYSDEKRPTALDILRGLAYVASTYCADAREVEFLLRHLRTHLEKYLPEVTVQTFVEARSEGATEPESHAGYQGADVPEGSPTFSRPPAAT